MNTDFLDAHERHWEDAELLSESARHANADHLYGVAAECGLKRLMCAFGMGLDADGRPPPGDRLHADGIWDRYEAYRSSHHLGTGYPLPGTNPFSDWDVNQRYAHRSGFDGARAGRHRVGAEHVRRLIAQARKDGLL